MLCHSTTPFLVFCSIDEAHKGILGIHNDCSCCSVTNNKRMLALILQHVLHLVFLACLKEYWSADNFSRKVCWPYKPGVYPLENASRVTR